MPDGWIYGATTGFTNPSTATPEDASVMTVGVDPGKSTGVRALLDHRPWAALQVVVDTPEGMYRLETALNDLFDEARRRRCRLLVGCERFVTNRRTSRLTHQPHAVEVAGRVAVLSPVDVTLQAVPDAKRFASNDRLRALGLWVTPAEVGRPDADDANDATRHVLLLLARRANRHYLRLLEERGLAPTPSP